MKDESIQKVLNEVKKSFGSEKIKVLNYWDSDLCSAGITSADDTTDIVIYISTYNKPNGLFYFELDRRNIEKQKLISIKGDVDLEELFQIIEKYLGVARIDN